MAQRSDTAGSAVPSATGIGRLGSRPAGAGLGSPLSRRRLREQLIGWAFALPFVLVFTIFLAGPIVASAVMSFTDFGLRDLRNPLGTDFVGLANYQALLDDPKFHKAMINTAYFVIVGVPLTLFLGLAIALALDRGIKKFRTLFRVGYYLPVVTSIVAVSVVWKYLYRDNGGVFNTLLSWVGLDGPAWLDSTTLALPSLIVMAAWRNFGTLMIIFLAGLQTIPKEMNEAAEVDGATGWGRFRYITLPMLRPVLLFGAVITGIGYLQFFEEAFVMTKGGPLDATRSVTYFTFDQFGFGNFGYAAAASYLLFLAVVLLTFVQFRLLGERDDKVTKRRAKKADQARKEALS